jgi:hypothetical protein
MIWGFIICSLRQILLRWSSQGGWDGLVIWDAGEEIIAYKVSIGISEEPPIRLRIDKRPDCALTAVKPQMSHSPAASQNSVWADIKFCYVQTVLLCPHDTADLAETCTQVSLVRFRLYNCLITVFTDSVPTAEISQYGIKDVLMVIIGQWIRICKETFVTYSEYYSSTYGILDRIWSGWILRNPCVESRLIPERMSKRVMANSYIISSHYSLPRRQFVTPLHVTSAAGASGNCLCCSEPRLLLYGVIA